MKEAGKKMQSPVQRSCRDEAMIVASSFLSLDESNSPRMAAKSHHVASEVVS